MILAKKIFINVALTSSIFILSLPALALKSDSQQPIQINSIKQSLDLEKNITTFTENVVIKQGSIDVRADKVVVARPNGDAKKMVVEAYGTPATFYQLQDDGKPIKGHSDKIRYEMEKELVILTGNAYLEQLDSNIKGEKITYLVPTQQIEAFSDKGKRVTTILLPSQLQEKDPGVKSTNNSKSK
ncbi:MAG: lipopolysaccharide ABC transporter substrate-binding protein LptA [Candidatus Phlomobacter fragariae]